MCLIDERVRVLFIDRHADQRQDKYHKSICSNYSFGIKPDKEFVNEQFPNSLLKDRRSDIDVDPRLSSLLLPQHIDG